WVNFKLFGMMGLTLGFVVLQAFYLARHIRDNELETEGG
ncbi:MAG: septation protein A, partial [gamma proteobacterium symbiont of Ctena orbiculata]